MNRYRTEIVKAQRSTALNLIAGSFLALTGVSAGASNAFADGTSAQVSAAVETYIHELIGDRYSRVNSDVQALDSRMQLQPCQTPLQLEHRPRDRIGGRITFKVTCPDTAGWSVHIPASIQLFDQVVVAANPIPMGTQLSDKDLVHAEMDVSLLRRGYFTEAREVSGFVTKRPISAGQVLTPVIIDPANLVAKGENVMIIAVGSGIEIRASGIAMADGILGELIQVKNTKTNKVVEGRITAPGQVKVSL